MLAKLFLVVTVFSSAIVQGNAVVPSAHRQGNANQYYLYTRKHNEARTPLLLMPEDFVSMTTTTTLSHSTTRRPGGGTIIVTPAGSSTTPMPPPIHVQLMNSSLDTVVVIHGHADNAKGTFTTMIRNAFFSEVRKDVNVNLIVLDWSTYTQQTYSIATSAVHSVGRALGEFLKQLVDENKIRLETLHLIGFNLGAHVVGFAGRTLNGKAARITGLDPSRRNWGDGTPRLSKSDATYVEVIHTDGDGIFANGIGTAIGDVDFFVNGGANQPGCLTHICHHNRGYEVFAATLTRGNRLVGSACRTNLQLTLNRCGAEDLHIGGDDMFKRHSFNVYRVNTRRSYPF